LPALIDLSEATIGITKSRYQLYLYAILCFHQGW
jgi:hypothetical protein